MIQSASFAGNRVAFSFFECLYHFYPIAVKASVKMDYDNISSIVKIAIHTNLTLTHTPHIQKEAESWGLNTWTYNESSCLDN